MASIYWKNLSVTKQQFYSRQYQQGYAHSIGKPIEKIFAIGKTELVMRLIPPGRFWMGSQNEKCYRSKERHIVLITYPYWMSKYEITQAQWKAIMGFNRSRFKDVGENAPIENVTWKECQKFCNKTKCSLPSEAQWEYACRAGTTTPFNLGNTITPTQVNYCGSYPYGGSPPQYRKKTVIVGSLDNSNVWGLYDMHGNVREFCRDWMGKYGDSEQINPTGPLNGDYRIIRGGCWLSSMWLCASASRDAHPPLYCIGFVGFRVIKNIQNTGTNPPKKSIK